MINDFHQDWTQELITNLLAVGYERSRVSRVIFAMACPWNTPVWFVQVN